MKQRSSQGFMAKVKEKERWVFDKTGGSGDSTKANPKYIQHVEEKKLDEELLVFHHKPAPFTIFPFELMASHPCSTESFPHTLLSNTQHSVGFM